MDTSGEGNGGSPSSIGEVGGSVSFGGTSGSPGGSGTAGNSAAGSGAGNSAAGSGTAGSGVAGGVNAGGGGDEDPCAGGTPDPSPAASVVDGHGFVELNTSTDNPIVSLVTTLIVPPKPPPSGTLFLWPGLQPLPGGASYSPIDNGVLQPVLTWGPTCAPNAPLATPYEDWWVSAQYVNTFGSAPGYTGCLGGPGMLVPVGDRLRMTFTLDGTIWRQVVQSEATGQEVSFDIDLQGQSQHRAEFLIEPYDSLPISDVQFDATVIRFAKPSPSSCHVLRRGLTDEVAIPVSSPDGTACCVPSITLKAPGI